MCVEMILPLFDNAHEGFLQFDVYDTPSESDAISTSSIALGREVPLV